MTTEQPCVCKCEVTALEISKNFLQKNKKNEKKNSANFKNFYEFFENFSKNFYLAKKSTSIPGGNCQRAVLGKRTEVIPLLYKCSNGNNIGSNCSVKVL